MDKIIDPISDLGFKYLFGREKLSEPVLRDFLNALLSGSEGFEEIASVTYLNNERTAEWKDGKSIRYDILCQTESNHRFIVEMQKASQPKFIDRATFYVARGIAEQGYRGKAEEDRDWDYSLEPVIGVFICHDNVRGLERKPIVRAAVLDEENFKPIGVKTRYIFVQLKAFEKKESECESINDKWIYNIKNMGIKQEVAFKQSSDVFQRLEQVANLATLTPQQRYDYEADLKVFRDTVNQIRGAHQEGIEEEMRRSFRMMLAFGIPPEQIAEKYGLSAKDIERMASSD